MKRVVEYSLALVIDIILLMSVVSNLDVKVRSNFKSVASSFRIVADYILILRKLWSESSSSNSFRVTEFRGPYSGLTVLHLGV